MKHAHTLLAATLAGLSATALADVTLYGAIDETLESVSARGAANSSKNIGQTTRINSNSSLIGFKGSEDLGNGLKAIWQVESGVAIDTGGGNFASPSRLLPKSNPRSSSPSNTWRCALPGMSGAVRLAPVARMM